MRRSILAACAVLATACGAGDANGPGTVIRVRLLDDRGANAGRNQVVITLADSSRLTRVSRSDGTLDIAVAGGGTYRVSVIPRSTFVGSPSLTREVSVEANRRTVVEFTLYRYGTPPEEPNYSR